MVLEGQLSHGEIGDKETIIKHPMLSGLMLTEMLDGLLTEHAYVPSQIIMWIHLLIYAVMAQEVQL